MQSIEITLKEHISYGTDTVYLVIRWPMMLITNTIFLYFRISGENKSYENFQELTLKKHS